MRVCKCQIKTTRIIFPSSRRCRLQEATELLLSSSMQALPGAITMARLSYQWKQSEWCQGRPDLDPLLIGSSSLICVDRFRGDCFERCSKQRHTNVGFRHFSHKELAPKIYFLVLLIRYFPIVFLSTTMFAIAAEMVIGGVHIAFYAALVRLYLSPQDVELTLSNRTRGALRLVSDVFPR